MAADGVSQGNCLQSLYDLAETGRASPALNGAVYLKIARSIARLAPDCDDVTITVDGYSAISDDEVENLLASWQHAEGIIASLAQEGLDVSAFRPLGFGSRTSADADNHKKRISFRIVPRS